MRPYYSLYEEPGDKQGQIKDLQGYITLDDDGHLTTRAATDGSKRTEIDWKTTYAFSASDFQDILSARVSLIEGGWTVYH